MKFEQKELRIKKITPAPEQKAGKMARFGKRFAAAALGTFMLIAPLVSGNAKAEDKWAPQEGPHAGEAIDLETGEHEVKGEAGKKKGKPAAETSTDKKLAETIRETDAVLKSLDEFSEEMERVEQGNAPKDNPPAEETEEDVRDKIVRHNVVFPLAPSSYNDPALSPFQDEVEVGGEPRKMTRDNPIDLGVNFLANEAGEAAFGAFRYRNLARLDAGVLSFRGPLAPFGRIMLRPELNVWRLKGVYYGSAAFMGNMASWVYSSHSVGLGYSQPIGENFRLRMGGIFGGALSYPAYDDTYVNFSVGISAEIAKTLLLYGVPTFYFSANDPIKTAYVGYYEPKFQDVEVGAQIRLPKGFTVRAFADIGLIGDNYGINDRYGFRGTRTVSVRDKAVDADIDIWLSLGMTHWSQQLGGRMDPAVMVGMNIVLGAEGFNSTNTAEYSHLQNGSIEFAETDIPDREHPGPYGFGKSGDAYYDVPINEMKQRMLESGSFEEFKNSYGNLSEEEVVVRARFLGAFMQQVAYANDAYDSMTNGNIFDPEIERIANASNEDIFQYLQEYIGWYQNNSGPMPENLKNGIAVCAGIHWLMAEFMRANGVDAIVMSVNTPNGMHVITAAQLKDKTLLLDYGNTYQTPQGTVDQGLRFYGWNNGAPTFQSQFFGPDGYMGTYLTSEGRLLHRTVGLDNPNLLKMDFLGVR